jgi:hypothetical protein
MEEAVQNIGKVLTKKDLIVFMEAKVAEIDGKFEPVCSCRAVINGQPSCIVGFVPRYLHKYFKHFHGKFAQVTELYWESELKYKKEKSHKNCGMVEM